MMTPTRRNSRMGVLRSGYGSALLARRLLLNRQDHKAVVTPRCLFSSLRCFVESDLREKPPRWSPQKIEMSLENVTSAIWA
jgi:hypothetical protein